LNGCDQLLAITVAVSRKFVAAGRPGYFIQFLHLVFKIPQPLPGCSSLPLSACLAVQVGAMDPAKIFLRWALPKKK